ncbi:hypothetical protein BDV59DRAFT_202576 [Aspergillus ambiguus]|uniref:uncharacterized protein n=1 Tax=Aspergillus ambiguus TaxID=176160 RepID=UPI003CCD127B
MATITPEGNMTPEVTDISVKTEEDTPSHPKAPSNDTLEPTTPTPKKRGRKKATTPATPADEEMNEEAFSKKAKSTPSKKSLGPIPTSLEAAGMTDRMIIRMRDQENRNWTDITKAYVEHTGVQVGGSTLRMRYTTMKANFASISEDDVARLLKFKKEIEDKFEQEKWHRVADAIEGDGGAKLPPAALQKKYKEVLKGGAADA